MEIRVWFGFVLFGFGFLVLVFFLAYLILFKLIKNLDPIWSEILMAELSNFDRVPSKSC